ncbi:MAG: hypothetical protein ACLPPF_20770 [Rhodomicrobium sp.]
MTLNKDIVGYIIIFVVAAIMVTLGLVFRDIKKNQVRTDPTTYCKLHEPLEEATIVIIDKTDPFSPAQQAIIREKLLQIKEGIAQYSRLSIHILWNEKELAAGNRQLMFSLCNPGQRKDANRFYENPGMIQANYDKTFRIQFDNILAGLLQPGTAAFSPIADTFFGAIEAEEAVKNAKKKRIILISDLLEYTKDANFYDPKLVSWEKLKARMSADSPACLRDTTVEVIAVTRDKKFQLQNTLLKDAWRKLFEHFGIDPAFEFI